MKDNISVTPSRNCHLHSPITLSTQLVEGDGSRVLEFLLRWETCGAIEVIAMRLREQTNLNCIRFATTHVQFVISHAKRKDTLIDA